MSLQTTLGRFGFENRISHRSSVMQTKVPDFVSTMSRTIEAVLKSGKTVIIKLAFKLTDVSTHKIISILFKISASA